MAGDKKDELVRFLEARAFNPVLNAKAAGGSEAEQKRLERVQKATIKDIRDEFEQRSEQLGVKA